MRRRPGALGGGTGGNDGGTRLGRTAQRRPHAHTRGSVESGVGIVETHHLVDGAQSLGEGTQQAGATRSRWPDDDEEFTRES